MYKDGAARRSVLRAAPAAAAAAAAGRRPNLGDEVLDGFNDDTRVGDTHTPSQAHSLRVQSIFLACVGPFLAALLLGRGRSAPAR